ncbi:MAG: hypothetical protein R2749_27200 [Acidimicrobiales bacterium]
MAGETVLDEGSLGPLMLYLMLANSTDVATAINGAYGWGGDAYVMVRNGDQTCMRISYQGDTGDDLRELHGALTRWAVAAPGCARWPWSAPSCRSWPAIRARRWRSRSAATRPTRCWFRAR